MRTIVDDTRVNILSEQFVPDNVFIYLAKGAIRVFDGGKTYTYHAGDACLARKNRLVKYELLDKEGFHPILFCFEETFLRRVEKKYRPKATHTITDDAILNVQKSVLIDSFIQSVKPYYKGVMQLDEAFEEVKYEELLIILLKNQPELALILFDFRKPGKIDLEKFMMNNYRFNVSLDRFSFLTGRSLSAFKRDFKQTFNDTPSHWLIQKRLDEAHFLISGKNAKPSQLYIDLGFETLSHFSFAFKKRFGQTPTQLLELKQTAGDY